MYHRRFLLLAVAVGLWAIPNCFVRDASGQSFDALDNEAGRLLALERYAEAIVYYEAALRVEPFELSCINNIGTCYGNLGDYGRAQVEYRRALAVADNPRARARWNAQSIHHCRAYAYYSLKDYNNALRQSAAALSIARTSFNYLYCGKASLKLGRYQQAVDYLSSALRASGSERWGEAHFSRGEAYLCLGDSVRALADFSQAKKLGQNACMCWGSMGSAYRMKGEYDRARECYQQASDLAPDDASVCTTSVSLDVELGRGQRAGSRAREIIAQELGPVAVNFQWIAIYGALGFLQVGNDAAAQQLLTDVAAKCNRANWPYPLIAYLRGERSLGFVLELAEGLQERTEAEAIIGLHLWLTGEKASGQRHLEWVSRNGYRCFLEYFMAKREFAILHDWSATDTLREASRSIEVGSFRRALRLLDALIAKNASIAGAYAIRASVHNQLGNAQLARKDVDRAVELTPKEASAYLDLGRVTLSLGDTREALAHLEKALQLDPKIADALFYRGRTLALLGDANKAIVDFSQALRLGTSHTAEAYARRGDCLYANKQYIDALGDYQSALQAAHAHPAEIACRSALIKQHQGRHAEAVSLYHSALQLDPTSINAYLGRVIALLCMNESNLASKEAIAFIDLHGKSSEASQWMAILASFACRKSGDESLARTILSDSLVNHDAKRWPQPLVRYLIHELSTEALLDCAADDRRATEALTVIGHDLLLSGETSAARHYTQTVCRRGTQFSPIIQLAIIDNGNLGDIDSEK